MVGFRGLDWIYNVPTNIAGISARAQGFESLIAFRISPRKKESELTGRAVPTKEIVDQFAHREEVAA